jgi:hypothetical protein
MRYAFVAHDEAAPEAAPEVVRAVPVAPARGRWRPLGVETRRAAAHGRSRIDQRPPPQPYDHTIQQYSIESLVVT